MNKIERNFCLNHLIEQCRNEHIKVMSNIHRCGKSPLLFAIITLIQIASSCTTSTQPQPDNIIPDETVENSAQRVDTLSQSDSIRYVPTPNEENSAPIIETEEKQPFLITKYSAGFFTLGDTIGNLIQYYGWKEEEMEYYGDGCLIPYRYVKSDTGEVIELSYTFAGGKGIEDEELYKSDTINYMYVESDNCGGYYNRNKIESMAILSDKFRTKEGIGVGSTFSELEATYTITDATCYENVDGMIFTTVSVNEYPNMIFYFSNNDITINTDREEALGYIKLNSSHFKPNARVAEVRMGMRY